MQNVYHDGSVGEIKDFGLIELQKSLKDLNVDHVKVFNRETGGQVEIEMHDLQVMITGAVEAALKKREIMQQFEALDKGLGRTRF